MIWQAIGYVSSGLTLIAFLAAVVAFVYKIKAQEKERLILAANSDARAKLVQSALEFFNVETSGLTKEQQTRIVLEQIHARARRFAITAAVICFLAFAAAALAVYAIKYKVVAQNESRFDVKFGDINFFKIGDKIRGELVLHATSLTRKNEEAATVFLGMITVNDEELFDINRVAGSSTCKEVKSCLAAKVFEEYADNPLIVRGGGSHEENITYIFDVPGDVKLLRVFWEFYQREANDQGVCVVDDSKLPPKEGIPFLKVVTGGGDNAKGTCWRATDFKIVRINI